MIPNKIFLAGPVDAKGDFYSSEFRLSQLGKKVLNPYKLDPIWTGEGDPSYEDFVRAEISAMAHQCNAIYLIKGWETSQYAQMHKQIAEILGFEVMYQ